MITSVIFASVKRSLGEQCTPNLKPGTLASLGAIYLDFMLMSCGNRLPFSLPQIDREIFSFSQSHL